MSITQSKQYDSGDLLLLAAAVVDVFCCCGDARPVLRCSGLPCGCDATFEPITADNGVTYHNPCLARCVRHLPQSCLARCVRHLPQPLPRQVRASPTTKKVLHITPVVTSACARGFLFTSCAMIATSAGVLVYRTTTGPVRCRRTPVMTSAARRPIRSVWSASGAVCTALAVRSTSAVSDVISNFTHTRDITSIEPGYTCT